MRPMAAKLADSIQLYVLPLACFAFRYPRGINFVYASRGRWLADSI